MGFNAAFKGLITGVRFYYYYYYYYLLTYLLPEINEYQEYFLGGKGGRFIGLTILPPSCTECVFNLLEPSGPAQACNGIALPYYCNGFFHSVAAVLTQVQTKQMRINISKRNSTNSTKHNKYKYTSVTAFAGINVYDPVSLKFKCYDVRRDRIIVKGR